MKRTLIAAAAAGILIVPFYSTALAQKVDADKAKSEAKKRGCLNCHDIDKKKVGPALQDSAAKFKGKTAADLSASVKSKPVHAGALKQTADKDLKLMSEWILTLGK
ncbi:MAG: cytochrome C [Burkholderiales bacterium]